MIDLLKKENKITDALLGVAVGDALGVPFEFKSAAQMLINPCKDMIGYGTHQQPMGTWSDDSSLTFCLAESLTQGYHLPHIAKQFILWRKIAFWTAHQRVFDIGITTNKALQHLEDLMAHNEFHHYKLLKVDADEWSNGNGSLMRILPLLFYIKGKPLKEQFEIIWDVSALTHPHIRSAMSCLIYLKIAEFILLGQPKIDAYLKTRTLIEDFWKTIDFPKHEQAQFQRIIQNDIRYLSYEELKSGGYVIESLEASVWCFLQHNNYKNAILAAINKGHDTDTTAAITGGLSALFYGKKSIPTHWLVSLVRLEDILDLGQRLQDSLESK